MADSRARATAAIRRALDAQTDPGVVRLSLPRGTADLVLALIEAEIRAEGSSLPPRWEVSPAQAAAMLGLSRPQVDGLLDQGRLAHRRLGGHRRIPVASVLGFRTAERTRQRKAMADLADLSNELGLVE